MPTIYGEGAPAIQPTEGLRYIDTVANAEYAAYGGAWVALGGGGSGLPYVLGPYSVYVYGDSQTPITYGGFFIYGSSYSYYGGNVRLASGQGMGGDGQISLNSYGGSMSFSTTNNINLSAGTGITPNLPLAPGAAGTLWNNLGIVTVV